MTIRGFLAAMLLCGLAGPVVADERVTLGWGRMFTNDALGDTDDRWRTGSYSLSRVRGPSWSGELPGTFGEILEFRARAEIIAPENLTSAAPGDRRYAGVLTLGVHSHFQAAGLETSLGLDLAITGRQSGISSLQDALHDLLDMTRPRVASNQLGNGFHPTRVLETGHGFQVGRTDIRPFAEAQAGLETFVRAGLDLSFGTYGRGALMIREHTTGQRYRAVAGDVEPGLTFTLGGDVARVFDSELLPEGGAAVLSDTRQRLRAGIAWQGDRSSVLFGLTWLGKEFEGQREGQTVGSINLQLNF